MTIWILSAITVFVSLVAFFGGMLLAHLWFRHRPVYDTSFEPYPVDTLKAGHIYEANNGKRCYQD